MCFSLVDQSQSDKRFNFLYTNEYKLIIQRECVPKGEEQGIRGRNKVGVVATRVGRLFLVRVWVQTCLPLGYIYLPISFPEFVFPILVDSNPTKKIFFFWERGMVKKEEKGKEK